MNDYRDEPTAPYTFRSVVEWIQYRARVGGQPPIPGYIAEARAGKWIQDRRREYRDRARLADREEEELYAATSAPIAPPDAQERVAQQLRKMRYRQKRDLVQFFLKKQELTEEEQQILLVLKDDLGAHWDRPFNAPPSAYAIPGGLPGLGKR